MPRTLTATEQMVYEYLLDFLGEHTYQPSVREIGRQFSIKSTKTVSQLLHAIAAKGYIELDPARSRGVRILGYASPRQLQPVPVYERLARDGAALRPEHRTRFITLDRTFVPSPDVFFVRAGDDAMEARGVLRGDWVLVRPGTPSTAGALVAARHGESAVIRSLVARNGQQSLVAAAANEPEIPLRSGGNAVVLGEVCGVCRAALKAAS